MEGGREGWGGGGGGGGRKGGREKRFNITPYTIYTHQSDLIPSIDVIRHWLPKLLHHEDDSSGHDHGIDGLPIDDIDLLGDHVCC